MIENLPEDKLEALIEKVVSKSHMAIAKVQYNGLGDICTKLAVHTEILNGILKTQEGIVETNKIRNGRIEKLESCNVENKASLKTTLWLGGLFVSTIVSLSLYIYHTELSHVVTTSDGIKVMLVEHIKSSNEILSQLKTR